LMSSYSCHMRVSFLPHVHVVWIADAIRSKCSLIGEHYVARIKEGEGGLKNAPKVPPTESYTAWRVVGIQSLHFCMRRGWSSCSWATRHTATDCPGSRRHAAGAGRRFGSNQVQNFFPQVSSAGSEMCQSCGQMGTVLAARSAVWKVPVVQSSELVIHSEKTKKLALEAEVSK
jgi:hypothetical protein